MGKDHVSSRISSEGRSLKAIIRHLFNEVSVACGLGSHNYSEKNQTPWRK